MKLLSSLILFSLIFSKTFASNLKDPKQIKRIKAKTYKCITDVLVSRKGGLETIEKSAVILDDLQYLINENSRDYRDYRNTFTKCDELLKSISSKFADDYYLFVDEVRAFVHHSNYNGDEEKTERFMLLAALGNNTNCTFKGVGANVSLLVGVEAGMYVTSCEHQLSGERFYMLIPEVGVNVGIGLSLSIVNSTQGMMKDLTSFQIDRGESLNLALTITGANEFDGEVFSHGTDWGGCSGCRHRGHTIGLGITSGYKVVAGIKIIKRATNVALADEKLK